ncbi:MAG: DUF2993 domain-containing protein [Candidatus Nanopelagicales bacterium]
MKKVLVIVAAVVGVLLVLGVVGDRVADSVAERTISERVAAELSGASGVTTQIHGVPVLTQVAKGSLDHVTVTADSVPASGVALDDVVVELYGVSTSSPRTADTVEATASVTTQQLQSKLGDGWTVKVDGDALVASTQALGLLSVEARVIPAVRDGKLALDLDKVSVLGVDVSGDSIPSAVHERIDALVSSMGGLPLGLSLTGVDVTPTGVTLQASGTDVVLQ